MRSDESLARVDMKRLSIVEFDLYHHRFTL